MQTTKQCATGRQPLGNEIAPERWNHVARFPIGGSDQAGLAGAGFVASGARYGNLEIVLFECDEERQPIDGCERRRWG